MFAPANEAELPAYGFGRPGRTDAAPCGETRTRTESPKPVTAVSVDFRHRNNSRHASGALNTQCELWANGRRQNDTKIISGPEKARTPRRAKPGRAQTVIRNNVERTYGLPGVYPVERFAILRTAVNAKYGLERSLSELSANQILSAP